MALEMVYWLQRTKFAGHVYFDTFPRSVHNLTLTDPKRVVSTIVCGPLGGIYPYPSQFMARYCHWFTG
jgi:hypothetical protein